LDQRGGVLDQRGVHPYDGAVGGAEDEAAPVPLPSIISISRALHFENLQNMTEKIKENKC
jgi:hypothetical protein